VSKHFVAVSTNKTAVVQFGIPDDGRHIFTFWDFVGGRYSVWSSVGLVISLVYGHAAFLRLLEGAALMDVHFYGEKDWRNNMPVVMALLGIWYNNFCGAQTQAILPYEASLKELPSYLQQLDMESNGKCVTRLADGRSRPSGGNPKACAPSAPRPPERARWQTGPIVWGQVGTNGQHAFYQLMHQGTKLIPIDFMGGITSRLMAKRDMNAAWSGGVDVEKHHRVLLANMMAQSEALMAGTRACNDMDCASHGGTGSALFDGEAGSRRGQVPMYRQFEGNRPSSVILYECLDERTLGALLSLYEHKVFVMGHIWNIHSFDQWGVELGKRLTGNILREIADGSSRGTGQNAEIRPDQVAGTATRAASHDASTLALLRKLDTRQ
jgi:glucose-6-phosphate isomerase